MRSWEGGPKPAWPVSSCKVKAASHRSHMAMGRGWRDGSSIKIGERILK